MRRNAVLISIRPKWVLKIAGGKKDVELRKTRPSIETPFKCYIYCTEGHSRVSTDSANEYAIAKQMVGKCGKVIGEFVCDHIREYEATKAWTLYGKPIHYLGIELERGHTALFYDEIEEYGNGATLYAWHISNLKIYDKPKALSEFKRICPTKNQFAENCNGCQYSCYEMSHPVPRCAAHLTRPPQSWCYVEGVEV